MSVKLDKVLKYTQEIQKFVADRTSQTQLYSGIDQTLQELSESLKAGKLILQVAGHDLAQAHSLQRLLELSSELRDAYQLKISTIPEIPDPSAPLPFPALILQSSSASQPPVRYELKTSQTQVIGRNPAATQLLLADHFSLTSGSHAEVRILEGSWQIRDSGSRNGTFINGNSQKLQDWHILKAGDQICLGSASQSAGSATLVFEVPSKDDIHPAYAEAQRLLDCNILCLVIPPQPLIETVQRFIQLAQDSQITKLFIIVDRPGDITAEAFRETLATIKNSARNQFNNSSVELTSLLLKPFIPSSGATVLTPHSQPEFEQFYAGLKSLFEESVEAILTEWGIKKLNQIISQIEAILVQNDIALKEKLQKDEERFKELSQGNLKKQVEKVYKKVDGERDSFFRLVKTELSQSKSSLLDEFRQSSLPYKIHQFTKQLQPQVTDQGGYRYVRLKVLTSDTGSSSISDVHKKATELCHNELTRWATTEWSRIRGEYGDGGLDALFKKSYESLNPIPGLMLLEDSFSTSQTLSIQSVLNVSNVEPTVELRYKQVGLWGYMFKNLKGQIIAIVGTITMLSSSFAESLSFDVKKVLIPSLIPITLVMVWLSYKQDKESKVEEITEKLQKEAASYYQSYCKGLIDRLVQRIGGLLESEERRFRETLENAKEIHASHLTELDKTQSQLKSQLDEMKRSGQSKIEKDLVELRKLKQSI